MSKASTPPQPARARRAADANPATPPPTTTTSNSCLSGRLRSYMRKTRVALIDDHPLFRQGLRVLLDQQEDLEVVGEADDARRGYELAESQRPDLIVIDVSLPGVDGIAATRELL